MIDIKLIKKSKTPSTEIANIDYSWNRYVQAIKESMFKLPFPGKYTAQVEEEYMLIQGYSGPLVIDRVTGNGTTYLLTQPLKHESFKILGIWDKRAHFNYFTSDPILGFHYFGIESNGLRRMCTGDLEYQSPTDITSLKTISRSIINSLRVIYLESLGDIFVPPEYTRLKEILKGNMNIKEKISTLLNENWIQEFI